MEKEQGGVRYSLKFTCYAGTKSTNTDTEGARLVRGLACAEILVVAWKDASLPGTQFTQLLSVFSLYSYNTDILVVAWQDASLLGTQFTRVTRANAQTTDT
jgi:hypothetical protein